MAKKALIILADGFEEAEALVAIDLLRRGGIKVTVAGLTGTRVRGSHGIVVMADKVLGRSRASYGALILPGGGAGAAALGTSEIVRNLILSMNAAGKLIAAICAAPALVLAPSGILTHKKATCYPDMRECFKPDTTYVNKPLVVSGHIITSQGVGTVFEFSLAVIEKLMGKKIRVRVQKTALIRSYA